MSEELNFRTSVKNYMKVSRASLEGSYLLYSHPASLSTLRQCEPYLNSHLLSLPIFNFSLIPLKYDDDNSSTAPEFL